MPLSKPKLDSGQWTAIILIQTIIIGTTMLIVAWQEGWGSFKIDDS